MSKTNYAGINYAGPGSTVNTNPETGVRYGIISSNAVSHWALDDIYSNGTDEDYLNYIAEAKNQIKGALSDFISGSRLERAVESAFDAVSDDINDNYEGTGDCARYSYEHDGYSLQIDGSGDLWVLKSPYFTYAQFCSPCAPGACHLDSPLDLEIASDGLLLNPPGSNKCYCLGPDWFDDDDAPMPYRVYSVETGKLVQPGKE